VLDETPPPSAPTPSRRRSADATAEKYASTAGLDREALPRNERSDRAAGVIVVEWVVPIRGALCPRARVYMKRRMSGAFSTPSHNYVVT
jgi:hypothetical protein